MRRRLPLLLIMLFGATGCTSREAAEDEHRQATINVAAAIFEAATAIEQGTDGRLPLMAIKLAARQIILTQGGIWPRAEQWAKSLENESDK